MNHRPRTDARRSTPAGSATGLAAVLLLSAALPWEYGCRPSSSSRPTRSGSPESERAQQQEVFQYALRPFFNYWEYDTPEIFQQAVDRLDQWAREQEPPDWELDPMAATLPESLSGLLERLKVDQLEFPRTDAYALREAVWLRDVSNWARGDAVDTLHQAERLFDWTVRNVQVDPSPVGDGPAGRGIVLQQPWETLLFGRGTATDRAWLFMLLARQQRIDAGLVALSNPADSAARRVRPWAVAVLIEGELHLFDANLGLPIPAADGIQRGPSGELDVRPATLAEIAADESLLEQLDVDSEHPYPVRSEEVQRVVILLEASPTYLARRMKLVEDQLVGDDQVVLTTDLSAQAERFKKCEHVVGVRLWEMPYLAIIQQQELGEERNRWQQLQMVPFNVPFDVSPVIRPRSAEIINGLAWGTIEGREAAQEAERAAKEAIQAAGGEPPILAPALGRARLLYIKGELTGEKAAGFYYTKARIPDRVLNSPQIHPQAKGWLTRAKSNASYWLGLVAAQEGNSEAAIDWLKTRTLEADPDGPWTAGARYNLGRAYEAQGRIDEAVECYRADADAADRRGNLLRARWLKPTESAETAQSNETPAPPNGAESTGQAEKPASDPDEPPKSDSPGSAETSEEKADSSRAAESSEETSDGEEQEK